jgi:hypothetical protein
MLIKTKTKGSQGSLIKNGNYNRSVANVSLRGRNTGEIRPNNSLVPPFFIHDDRTLVTSVIWFIHIFNVTSCWSVSMFACAEANMDFNMKVIARSIVIYLGFRALAYFHYIKWPKTKRTDRPPLLVPCQWKSVFPTRL